MTISAQKQICNALVAVLSADPQLADGGVVANRRRPMAKQHQQKIFVYYEESVCNRGSIKGAPNDWATRIRLECIARAADGETADDLADALGTATYARIFENPTLGGLASDLECQAIALTEDEADTQICAMQILLSVTHRTPSNTLSA